MLKSQRILSFFSSPKSGGNGMPAAPGFGNGDGAAPQPSSPRAQAVQRLEGVLHEQLRSLLALELDLQDQRAEIASLA